MLQGPESYENMRNAIGILKLISEGESEIREGRIKPQEVVFDEIEKTLKKAFDEQGIPSKVGVGCTKGFESNH